MVSDVADMPGESDGTRVRANFQTVARGLRSPCRLWGSVWGLCKGGAAPAPGSDVHPHCHHDAAPPLRPTLRSPKRVRTFSYSGAHLSRSRRVTLARLEASVCAFGRVRARARPIGCQS